MNKQPREILLLILSFVPKRDQYRFVLASPRLFRTIHIRQRANMAKATANHALWIKIIHKQFSKTFRLKEQNPDKYRICPHCFLPVNKKKKRHWKTEPCTAFKHIQKLVEEKWHNESDLTIPKNCPLIACINCNIRYVRSFLRDVCNHCHKTRICIECNEEEVICNSLLPRHGYVCYECKPYTCSTCTKTNLSRRETHRCQWINLLNEMDALRLKTDGYVLFFNRGTQYLILLDETSHIPCGVIKNPASAKRTRIVANDNLYYELAYFAHFESMFFGRNRYPHCHNCHGENQSLKRCSRCKNAWYCSQTCQKIHWKNGHNKRCEKKQ